MKCKTCNHELIEGTRRCPYCGSEVSSSEDSSSEEFKWNVQDFPKPKKKKNVSIDWKSGRILDKEAGLVYDQSLNGWTEPEDVDGLFSFDTESERLQQKLDREMERIAEHSAGRRRSPSVRQDVIDFRIPDDSADVRVSSQQKTGNTSEKNVRDRQKFSPDSPFSAGKISGEENPWKQLREQKSEKKKTAEKETIPFRPDTVSQHSASDPDFTYAASAPERKISAPETLHFHRLSDSLKNDRPADVSQQSSDPSSASSAAPKASNAAEASVSSGRQADNSPENPRNSSAGAEKSAQEDRLSEEHVLSGFHRLIEAEKKFKEDMEKISYLSPEEYEKAEKAESRSQKLRFVPTISFRTIEDEYESYRREKETSGYSTPETETADRTGESPDSDRQRRNTDKDREIRIRIQEPSGTQFTVKTQEINLASLNNDPSVRTREVNLEEVKKTPKNVQVSVEVNAAQGNASVEVTRHHDGATVVKTVDESHTEHVYLDGKDVTEETAETAEKAPDLKESISPVSGDIPYEDSPYGDGTDIISDDAEADITADIVPEDSENFVETSDTEAEDELKDTSDDEHEDEETERNLALKRELQYEAIACGLTSSEAAQQTMQFEPLPEETDPEADPTETAAADSEDISPAAADTYDSADTGDASGTAAGKSPESDADFSDSAESEKDPAAEEDLSESPQSRPEEIPPAEETGEDPGRFWEKSGDISKMTITDIFGPDAHKIMEEGLRYRYAPRTASSASSEKTDVKSSEAEKETPTVRREESASPSSAHLPEDTGKTDAKEESGKRADDDSLILDITPEDIAPSKSQTAALHMPSQGASEKRGVTTDTISRKRQEEMKEALEALDTINESERRRQMREEKKAERELLRQKREEQKAEKSKRKAQEKAERQDTQKKTSSSLFRKNHTSSDAESSSFGPVARVLIIALTVILIVEFLIIGVKLLAPDSGAATLISRFESQITGIFSEENVDPAASETTGTSVPASPQTPDSSSSSASGMTSDTSSAPAAPAASPS